MTHASLLKLARRDAEMAYEAARKGDLTRAMQLARRAQEAMQAYEARKEAEHAG